MEQFGLSNFLYPGLLWPALLAEATSELNASFAKKYLETIAGPDTPPASHMPDWTTRNKVALELQTVRLRDFSLADDGVATLICAPFSLHGAAIVDFAAGHSLVAAFHEAGVRRVFVTDWRSADAQMRFLGIDNYLADINVMADQLGGVVNLVGLCQGGWMALLYAARFPEKVRKLVLAGSPVDIVAGETVLSTLARSTPLPVFEELVALGGGLVLGQRGLQFLPPQATSAEEIHNVLQSDLSYTSSAWALLEQRFRAWNAWAVNLPGVYFLEIVDKIFKRNEIATGRFVALGQVISLAAVKAPIYLLAAGDDELIAPQQLFATARLVGSAKDQIFMNTAACGHLSLYMGKNVLDQFWPTITHWLAEPPVFRR